MREFVWLEIDQAIATIRLDRPPMNALNAQVQDEIAAAAAEVSADSNVRAVVLYGGPKVFAAGADIKEMAGASYAQMAADSPAAAGQLHRRGQDPQAGRGRGDRVRARRRPRTGAVRGFPGRRRRAPRWASPRSCSGSSPARADPAAAPAGRPGPGQGHRVHRTVRGRAPRRLDIGLVDRVVPDAEVYDVARALVARYATGPAVALRAAKQAIDEGLETDLDTGLEIERLQFAGLFATEDQRTGMRSFVENGPGKATFAGR